MIIMSANEQKCSKCNQLLTEEHHLFKKRFFSKKINIICKVDSTDNKGFFSSLFKRFSSNQSSITNSIVSSPEEPSITEKESVT